MSTELQCYNRPLDDADLTRLAPAIFAPKPHESRSDRFVHIPSLPIIQGLRREGWQAYAVSCAKPRDASRIGFQKHLIRLRHDSNMRGAKGGVAELVMLAAHDGTSSFKLMGGWYEFLCANGLMVGNTIDTVSIPHRGAAGEVARAIAIATRGMLDNLHKLADQREEMLATPLSWEEQQAFARAALQVRYADGGNHAKAVKQAPVASTPVKSIPLEPWEILQPARRAEYGERVLRPASHVTTIAPKADLWHTFNVVQERLVRGGLAGVVRDRKGNMKIRKQRGVKGIDQSTALNRALWTLAEEMQRIKSGKTLEAVPAAC